MEIKLAPNAGFCFGVRAAINKGEKLIEEGKGPIATLGPLIHNPQEVARLESLGIRSYDELSDIQEKNVLIRTHGVAPSVYEDIEKSGHAYFDCTCPKVKKVQQIAREHAEAGYQVLILGDRNHPEVMAIVGWTGDTAIVFISLDELKALSLAGKKICLVSQTTEKLERFESAVAYLQSLELEELVIHNTICAATRDRQSDASDLAREVDLMVVIGGYNSANTCKLVSICQDAGVMTKHVESAADLEDEWFRGIEKIGLTAGASTPDWIIREVIDKMEELTMEQGLEQGYGTLEPLNLYDVVTGTVVKINPDEVMVDVGGKSEGVIPIKELSFQKDPDVEDIVKVGDEILLMATNKVFTVTEVGYFEPGEYLPTNELKAGEVGYIAASIKTLSDIHVGDTITLKKFAKSTYLNGILLLILIMASFTGEFITSISFTTIIIASLKYW